MAELTKSQIDKLGERLKKGCASEEDLRLLEEFKNSFAAPYEAVRQVLLARGLSPRGRPEKSTLSIVSKLTQVAESFLETPILTVMSAVLGKKFPLHLFRRGGLGPPVKSV